MRWMRRLGDRVMITNGKYAGHKGTVESNVYQRTVDWPDEYADGHHVMQEEDVEDDDEEENIIDEEDMDTGWTEDE